MEFSTNKVLDVGLIAFLAITLVFTASTGLVDKSKNAQTKATAKVDAVVTSYQ
ncbi:hypothetical protein LJR153_007299 [Paenibacillus sp. LjRoot153]|uniref:hypothetical protein n=1 Tax=Paenibacillus sp. LjRoot153 TaxID=3342270 RepID=UPI003ED11A7A